MLPAADALHVFLRGKRGMPGKNLETVEPAILHHEEPSRAAKGIEPANRARRAFRDRVMHCRSLLTSSQALTAALVRKRGLARSLSGTGSSPWVPPKPSLR